MFNIFGRLPARGNIKIRQLTAVVFACLFLFKIQAAISDVTFPDSSASQNDSAQFDSREGIPYQTEPVLSANHENYLLSSQNILCAFQVYPEEICLRDDADLYHCRLMPHCNIQSSKIFMYYIGMVFEDFLWLNSQNKKILFAAGNALNIKPVVAIAGAPLQIAKKTEPVPQAVTQSIPMTVTISYTPAATGSVSSRIAAPMITSAAPSTSTQSTTGVSQNKSLNSENASAAITTATASSVISTITASGASPVTAAPSQSAVAPSAASSSIAISSSTNSVAIAPRPAAAEGIATSPLATPATPASSMSVAATSSTAIPIPTAASASATIPSAASPAAIYVAEAIASRSTGTVGIAASDSLAPASGSVPVACINQSKDASGTAVVCGLPGSASSTVSEGDSEGGKRKFGPFVIPGKKSGKKKGQNVEDQKVKVALNGYRYLKFRFYGASGDKNSFLSNEGLITNGRHIEQGTNLKLGVNIGEKTKFDADFYELPDQDRKTTVHLAHQAYDMTYGNFNGGIDNTKISPFSKSIDGFQFKYDKKPYQFKFLTSKSNSQTITRTFTGSNQKGPYDLGASNLVEGSIIVRKNGTVISKDNYTVDIFIGNITFSEIQTPQDVISVTFEQTLTGGLNEGGITGLSFDYTQKSKVWTYGGSHIVKQANRSAQQITASVNNEVEATTPGTTRFVVQHSSPVFIRYYDLSTGQGSEVITKNGSAIPLKAGVDYNVRAPLETDAQYQKENADRYLNGYFDLAAPLTSTDVIMISYAYYTSTYIQKIPPGRLALDPTLQYAYPNTGSAVGKIYYGSERIKYCDNDAAEVSTCGYLIPGLDYSFDMPNNRFTINQPYNTKLLTNGSFLYLEQASTYPDVTQISSKYDQTVDAYHIGYEPGKKFNVHLETAQSLADVSSKPIAETNHIVAIVATQPLVCPSQNASDTTCVKSLGNIHIVAGSVLLFKNNLLTNGAVLLPGKDYTADEFNGTVTLYTTIPAGTVLRANYQYNLPDMGLVSGHVTSIDSALQIQKTNTNIQTSFWMGDPLFSSIGGEGNLNKSQTSITISQSIADYVSVSANLATLDSADDVHLVHETKSRQADYSFSFNEAPLKFFSFSFGDRTQIDNRDPHLSDSSEKHNSFKYANDLHFLKNAKFSYSYSDAKVTDNTVGGSNLSSVNKDMGFTYKPSKKLSFDSTFVVSVVGSSSDIESYTSKNTSTNMKIAWQPAPVVSINASINNQKMADSRPGAALSNIYSTMIGLTTKPFGKINPISISMTQQTTPGANGVTSGSSSYSVSSGYTVSKAVRISPSYTHTQTTISNTAGTSGDDTTYTTEYRPPGRKYHLSLSTDNGSQTMTDSALNRSTTQSTTGLTAIAGYDPSKTLAYAFKWNSNGSSASDSGSTNNTTYNFSMNRNPKKDVKQWVQFTNTVISGTQSSTSSIFEIGDDAKMNKLLSMNFLFRHSIFKAAGSGSGSYSGNTLTGALRADF